jgi:hypothetical protein
MNITIGLNPHSIKDAKKEIRKLKQKFSQHTIDRRFLRKCVSYLKKKMSEYLEMSGIGSNVVEGIMRSWEVNIEETKVTMTNRHQKAVFVEFGVGIVGGGNPHPMASQDGYIYNKPSDVKSEEGEWHFYSNEADLDIPKDAITWGSYGKGRENRMSIKTKGTKGVWYAYNALQDLKMNWKTLWNEVKAEVLK